MPLQVDEMTTARMESEETKIVQRKTIAAYVDPCAASSGPGYFPEATPVQAELLAEVRALRSELREWEPSTASRGVEQGRKAECTSGAEEAEMKGGESQGAEAADPVERTPEGGTVSDDCSPLGSLSAVLASPSSTAQEERSRFGESSYSGYAYDTPLSMDEKKLRYQQLCCEEVEWLQERWDDRTEETLALRRENRALRCKLWKMEAAVAQVSQSAAHVAAVAAGIDSKMPPE